jgi:hypothetical protein
MDGDVSGNAAGVRLLKDRGQRAVWDAVAGKVAGRVEKGEIIKETKRMEGGLACIPGKRGWRTGGMF